MSFSNLNNAKKIYKIRKVNYEKNYHIIKMSNFRNSKRKLFLKKLLIMTKNYIT